MIMAPAGMGTVTSRAGAFEPDGAAESDCPLSSPRLVHQRRIRATLASKPVKIASPTRKWPMFNSASWGIAATGGDIVEGQAVAGMGLDAVLRRASAAASARRRSSAARSSPSTWA